MAAPELPQETEPAPTAISAPWIADDLRVRDVLLGAALHVWVKLRARLLRAPSPGWDLADQIAYTQLCRHQKEPIPGLAPGAPAIEKWLAEDLDPFEGIEKFYRT